MPRYQRLAGTAESSNPDQQHLLTEGRRSRTISPFYCPCIPVLFSTSRFISSLPNKAEIVGYLSGILFSIGWWTFIDGIVYTSTKETPVPIRFEDFIPGILSTIALIMVNLIDRDALNADDFTFSGDHIASKARAFAFVGVTVALGSIGGACALLVFKYIIPGYTADDQVYFGETILVQNILIFLSSMILWFGRNTQEYESFGLY